ncbi:MAG: hypothetical protein GX256_05740 [Fretibacterium sp.]|nr:hypothetical protein [Fretibacterium sp.]
MKRLYVAVAVALLLMTTGLFPGTTEAAELPKKGSIAILSRSESRQHAALATSLFSQELISKGYKVVDPKRLEAIRKSKAAVAALDGDVNAIMNLGKQYGFSTMITLNVRAGRPVLNEFDLYTGTASVAVMVTASSGQEIYADTARGKQVGYTEDEAQDKALEAAVVTAVKKMTGGR